MQDFEGAFSEFLDGADYDRAEAALNEAVRAALYQIMRASFAAGWRAAVGPASTPQDRPEENS